MAKLISSVLIYSLFFFSVSLSAQNNVFTVEGVPFDMPQNGFEGYANLRMQPVCGGEPRIKVAVDKVVVKGFNMHGSKYVKQYEYDFPIELTDGNIYLSGGLRFTLPGTNTQRNYFFERTNITIMLQAFMDWIVMEDAQMKALSCSEWISFFRENFSSAQPALRITDEDCLKRNKQETCLYSKLVNAYEYSQDAEEVLADFSELYHELANKSSANAQQWNTLYENVNKYNWPEGWDESSRVDNLKYLINKERQKSEEKDADESASTSSSSSKSSSSNDGEENDEDDDRNEQRSYDDSDEAVAARVSARMSQAYIDAQQAEARGDYKTAYQQYKKYNSYKPITKRDLNKEETLLWGSIMQDAFHSAMQQRRREEEEATRRFEQRLAQEKRDAEVLREEYEKERKRLGLLAIGQNNIAKFLISGGDLKELSEDEIVELFNQDKYPFEFSKSPYHIFSIYDNVVSDSIYMFNYYNNFPGQLYDMKIGSALTSYKLGNKCYGSYSCIAREIRKMKQSKRKMGISEIVAVPLNEFKKLFPETSSFKRVGMYLGDGGTNVLNEQMENVSYLDVMMSTDKEKLQKLQASLRTKFTDEIDLIEIPKPAGSTERIEELITYNQNQKREPQFGPDLYNPNDRNTYKTVKIGDQLWMAENLRSKRGRYIDHLGRDWMASFDEEYIQYYYSPTTAGQLCPNGWRLPNYTDVYNLNSYLKETHGLEITDEDAPLLYDILNRNYGFTADFYGFAGVRSENPGSTYYSVQKRNKKFSEKLKDWYQSEWVISGEPNLGDGNFNEVPYKLMKKTEYKKEYSSFIPYPSLTFNHFENMGTDRFWFWISNVKYEEGVPQQFYIVGLGKENMSVYIDSSMDSFYPCRCIKE